MVKLITFVRRNPQLSQEEFIHQWKVEHAPLIRSSLPGLRKYIASFPTGVRVSPAEPAYDAIVELGFDSVDAMQAQLGHPRFNTPERLASSAALVAENGMETLVVEEVEVAL